MRQKKQFLHVCALCVLTLYLSRTVMAADSVSPATIAAPPVNSAGIQAEMKNQPLPATETLLADFSLASTEFFICAALCEEVFNKNTHTELMTGAALNRARLRAHDKITRLLTENSVAGMAATKSDHDRIMQLLEEARGWDAVAFPNVICKQHAKPLLDSPLDEWEFVRFKENGSDVICEFSEGFFVLDDETQKNIFVAGVRKFNACYAPRSPIYHHYSQYLADQSVTNAQREKKDAEESRVSDHIREREQHWYAYERVVQGRAVESLLQRAFLTVYEKEHNTRAQPQTSVVSASCSQSSNASQTNKRLSKKQYRFIAATVVFSAIALIVLKHMSSPRSVFAARAVAALYADTKLQHPYYVFNVPSDSIGAQDIRVLEIAAICDKISDVHDDVRTRYNKNRKKMRPAEVEKVILLVDTLSRKISQVYDSSYVTPAAVSAIVESFRSMRKNQLTMSKIPMRYLDVCAALMNKLVDASALPFIHSYYLQKINAMNTERERITAETKMAALLSKELSTHDEKEDMKKRFYAQLEKEVGKEKIWPSLAEQSINEAINTHYDQFPWTGTGKEVRYEINGTRAAIGNEFAIAVYEAVMAEVKKGCSMADAMRAFNAFRTRLKNEGLTKKALPEGMSSDITDHFVKKYLLPALIREGARAVRKESIHYSAQEQRELSEAIGGIQLFITALQDADTLPDTMALDYVQGVTRLLQRSNLADSFSDRKEHDTFAAHYLSLIEAYGNQFSQDLCEDVLTLVTGRAIEEMPLASGDETLADLERVVLRRYACFYEGATWEECDPLVQYEILLESKRYAALSDVEKIMKIHSEIREYTARFKVDNDIDILERIFKRCVRLEKASAIDSVEYTAALYAETDTLLSQVTDVCENLIAADQRRGSVDMNVYVYLVEIRIIQKKIRRDAEVKFKDVGSMPERVVRDSMLSASADVNTVYVSA